MCDHVLLLVLLQMLMGANKTRGDPKINAQMPIKNSKTLPDAP